MLWGDTFFLWESLARAMKYILRYYIHDGLRGMNILSLREAETVHLINNVHGFRTGIKERGRLTLIHMVSRTHAAEVTDLRDKVYAMLGLTVDRYDAALYVSYSESASFVYKRVSKYLIEKYGTDREFGIELLYNAIGEHDGGPSWLLGWSSKSADSVIPFGGRGWYHASGKSLPTLRIAGDDSSVLAAGSKFDCIEKVTLPRRDYDEAFEDRASGFLDTWDWQVEARASALYPTGESKIQALITTLTADSTHFKKLERDIMLDSYLAYTTPLDEYGIKYGLGTEDQIIRSDAYRIRLQASHNRRFGVTQQGYFSLIPATAQVGDIICLLLGGDAPVVLRRDKSDGLYAYIGDCYVHGIMYGEAIERGDWHVEEFAIR